MGFNIILNCGDQIRHIVEDSPANRFISYISEESLYHIEPRGAGWCEVKLEARIALLPRIDLRMLVGGIVVTDDVDILVRRNTIGNVPQKI